MKNRPQQSPLERDLIRAGCTDSEVKVIMARIDANTGRYVDELRERRERFLAALMPDKDLR